MQTQKKLLKTIPRLLLLLPALFFLCTTASSQKMPANPAKLIEKSIENWNRVYGVSVTAGGWSYEGVINSDAKLKQVIVDITTPELAWLPDGDVNKPTQMTARSVADVPAIGKLAIMEWKAKVSSQIEKGQHIFKIKWKKGRVDFNTLCITDNDIIVYDNMISNIFLPAHQSRCLSYRMAWLWQTEYKDMTRGSITADLIIRCEGETPICDHRCNAWMTAGEAKIECKVTTTGNCCKLSWAYGWACGFKSLKFSAKDYSFEVEGYLGSSGTGDGSCTECCPKLPKVQASVMPKTRDRTAGGSVGTEGPMKVRNISVKTLNGEVVDYKIPNNIRPGDKFTFSAPGNLPSSTLEGMVVEVDNKKANINDSVFSFVVPIAFAAATIPILLKDRSGKVIGNSSIPVNQPNLPETGSDITLPPMDDPVPHPTGDFTGSSYCQPGQEYTINGFFDGDGSDTKVTIAGNSAQVIAESPRGSIIKIPEDINAGLTDIRVSEAGAAEVSFPVNVVHVNISANKTSLTKGANANITVTANGLTAEQLKNNDFNIRIENSSPANITFSDQASNIITDKINPDDIKNGVYTFKTKVKALQAGPYSLNCSLQSDEGVDCRKKYENCMAQNDADVEKCYKDCMDIEDREKRTYCILRCRGNYKAMQDICHQDYLKCCKEQGRLK